MPTKTLKQISEKQAAGFFWKLLELNAVPIITWDFSGEVLQANDAFYRLLGYSHEDFERGHVTWKQLTPSEYASLDENCMHQLHAKGTAKPYEKQYKCKDGRLIKVRLFNSVLDSHDQIGIAIIQPL